jgi:protein-S-isoprenylcysteine O-methyltransferase Ste14
MSTFTLKIIYFAGMVTQIIIRAPFDRQRRKTKVAKDRMDRREGILLGILFLSIGVLPLIYALTPWLDFANYTLPEWAAWLGIAIFIASLYVFWRAHFDLGRNWSPTLQILEGHKLVTKGIYAYIRHPMYASEWLWVFAQPLLLQNWIAGVGAALLFIPFYFGRVSGEEKMMLKQFGKEYEAYMHRSGRVIPKF